MNQPPLYQTGLRDVIGRIHTSVRASLKANPSSSASFYVYPTEYGELTVEQISAVVKQLHNYQGIPDKGMTVGYKLTRVESGLALMAQPVDY